MITKLGDFFVNISLSGQLHRQVRDVPVENKKSKFKFKFNKK